MSVQRLESLPLIMGLLTARSYFLHIVSDRFFCCQNNGTHSKGEEDTVHDRETSNVVWHQPANV